MYLYETHMHTEQGSACARTPGRDYVRYYRNRGFAGMVVTDHFWNGNCAIDRSLPWPDFVERFMRGYEDARREGEALDFDVFFGWEERFEGDEYLIIGLGRAWLLGNPDIVHKPREEVLKRVRAAGAAVIQAHPFRERNYIPAIHLCGAMCDAVETANFCNQRSEDALAAAYAARIGKAASSGNDMHEANPRQSPLMGIRIPYRPKSAQDFAALIRSGKGWEAVVPPGHHELRGNEETVLPVYEYDEEGRVLSGEGLSPR